MHSPELGRNEGTDSYTEKEEEEERAISEIGIRCREGERKVGGRISSIRSRGKEKRVLWVLAPDGGEGFAKGDL